MKADNACSQSANTCLSIPRLTLAPAAPGTISGPFSLCPLTSATYSIVAVANATSYIWSTTGGLIIVSGQGSIAIVVSSPAGFANGSVRVNASNCINISATKILNVANQPSTPIWKSTSPPPVAACPGTCYIFNIDNVQDAVSWTYTAPAGCVITSPNGTPGSGNPFTTTRSTATICFPAGFVSGTVTVYSTNPCGKSGLLSYPIRAIPLAPGPISGPTSGLSNTTGKIYTIADVTGAATYTWTVPAGATITNNIGKSITVSFGNFVTGNVCVRANSACGSSAYTCRAVSGAGPLQGTINSSISGTLPVSVNLLYKTAADEEHTGVTETFSTLAVYPNPASGKVTLTFNSNQNAAYTIKVVDMIGKVIINERISAVEGFNMKEIDLENASKGLYFISVQTEDGEIKTLRLMKE